MPSPFPGVDPYIESQAWEDFHTLFITAIREDLTPVLRPRYVVRVEERIYVERLPDPVAPIGPGITVVSVPERERLPHFGGTATVASPSFTAMIPLSSPERETYLVVRDRESMEVVTTIELLSPTNKRKGSTGRREYVKKRALVLRSKAHLVEIDLLRGGDRLPIDLPLRHGGYYVLICRHPACPQAQIHSWGLSSPLPTIPIPLAGDDPAVPLDLQNVFATLYDRAGYDFSLDYARPVEPPLAKEDQEWVRQVLKDRRLSS